MPILRCQAGFSDLQAFVSRGSLAGALALGLASCASDQIRSTPIVAPTTSIEAETDAVPDEPVFLVSDVLGQSPEKIDALFGEPAFVMAEGKGSLRRYAFSTCNILVLMTADTSGALTAGKVYAARRQNTEPKVDTETCLALGI
ncbi:MAG: hypothetical protein AAGH38_04360 [Pseudomonadota bacterium]